MGIWLNKGLYGMVIELITSGNAYKYDRFKVILIEIVKWVKLIKK